MISFLMLKKRIIANALSISKELNAMLCKNIPFTYFFIEISQIYYLAKVVERYVRKFNFLLYTMKNENIGI